MKTRFWIFVILLVVGAVIAGYSSGYYNGVRQTKIEAQFFLRDFTQATDLETYLQQQGYSDWVGRLRVYGIGGPASYIRSYDASVYTITAGVVCVAVGLVGLLFISRKKEPAA